jgi:hypothetical protein
MSLEHCKTTIITIHKTAFMVSSWPQRIEKKSIIFYIYATRIYLLKNMPNFVIKSSEIEKKVYTG